MINFYKRKRVFLFFIPILLFSCNISHNEKKREKFGNYCIDVYETWWTDYSREHKTLGTMTPLEKQTVNGIISFTVLEEENMSLQELNNFSEEIENLLDSKNKTISLKKELITKEIGKNTTGTLILCSYLDRNGLINYTYRYYTILKDKKISFSINIVNGFKPNEETRKTVISIIKSFSDECN